MSTRRHFLKLLVGAAGAALVPRKTYFFLNGLWQPDRFVWTSNTDYAMKYMNFYDLSIYAKPIYHHILLDPLKIPRTR